MEIKPERIAYLSLMREIEDFLYHEADLLDAREFDKWLDLFTEDVRYWMPMRKNLSYEDRARDITGDDDVSWIDDDKVTLAKRVKQIQTGIHWAEEPLSRVTHLVSNVRLARPAASVKEGASIAVNCHFIVHRNRLETETDFISGRREDLLRRESGSFKIASRKIIIDQTVLLAKNLSFFF
jgi:3-phenylpropionate/cinnamic acid dioxygenase small subunit